MSLTDDQGPLVPYGYSQQDFVADIRARVPEVEKHALFPYDEDPGLHIVTSDLARLVRAATKKQAFDVLERTFGLVNEAIERDDADPEVGNAVYISFMEPRDAVLLRDWGVWGLASPKLKRYIKQEGW